VDFLFRNRCGDKLPVFACWRREEQLSIGVDDRGVERVVKSIESSKR